MARRRELEMGINNNNNKQFLLNQLMWIGISLGISIVISIILPFPISLVAIIVGFHFSQYVYEKDNDEKGGCRKRTRNFQSGYRQREIKVLLHDLWSTTQSA